MKKLTIIKIGGNVINNEEELNKTLEDFAQIEGFKLLVHGGGKVASTLAKTLGVEPKMIDGRRITDAETIKIVTMVYAGLINKQIVAKLQAKGCNAMGFSGADGNLIVSHKRNHPTIDYGFVGDVDHVNGKLLKKFIHEGVTPIFCAITHDQKGTLLNTNADTVASELAIGLAPFFEVHLIFLFEKKGVLSNPEDDESVIENIDKDDYAKYKADGTISAGMLPKLDNAFNAVDEGVNSVAIGHAHMLGKKDAKKTVIKSEE